jgi:hypothetical protein
MMVIVPPVSDRRCVEMRSIRPLVICVAMLLPATGTALAVDWQCGPHYVSTTVLHGWPGEEKARITCRELGRHILVYPAYNQTREQADGKFDDDAEFSMPSRDFAGDLCPIQNSRTMRLTLSGQTMLPISNRNEKMIIRHIACGCAAPDNGTAQAYPPRYYDCGRAFVRIQTGKGTAPSGVFPTTWTRTYLKIV